MTGYHLGSSRRAEWNRERRKWETWHVVECRSSAWKDCCR